MSALVFNMVRYGRSGIKLSSISVTTPPNKTAYYAGETFDTTGMVITAGYTNGATRQVTGYTFSPSGRLSAGATTITISYSENGITKTTTQAITCVKTSLTIPSQSGTLTYSGSAQSPNWNNYNSGRMTIGGTTVSTNAGSYTATFAITDTALYQWSDGTIGTKSVTWSIGKATPTISLNPTSLTLTTSAKTGTIAVTKTGDGTISAVSSDTSKATVSVSGNTVTVTGVASGSATITVSMAATSNYNAPASKTCAVTVTLIPSFADVTWAQVISACQSNNVPDTWAVGNQKAMTIGGISYTVTIIGKNHDTYTGGGTAPLTFQLQDCYRTKYPMNSSNTNSGGWASCAMRSTSLPAILALMPAEVMAGIREVNKLTNAGAQSATINTTADKLFLLSEVEIFGSVTYAKSGEGTQYAYYAAGNSKVKNFSGSAGYWWERSPRGSDSAYFCYVGSDGAASASYASYSHGVAFGFCF